MADFAILTLDVEEIAVVGLGGDGQDVDILNADVIQSDRIVIVEADDDIVIILGHELPEEFSKSSTAGHVVTPTTRSRASAVITVVLDDHDIRAEPKHIVVTARAFQEIGDFIMADICGGMSVLDREVDEDEGICSIAAGEDVVVRVTHESVGAFAADDALDACELHESTHIACLACGCSCADARRAS